MRFWASLLFSGWACAAMIASAAPPRIDKIDPPGWWSDMPNPMLLVHGQGLSDAHFSLSGKGVAIERTQASANGHWAFVWLTTKDAAPQTLWITATNQDAPTIRRHIPASLRLTPFI
jgi:neopullulanase